MARDSRFHRGRASQRLVDATQIVIRELNRIRRLQVVPLLADSVCQARQASHVRSEGEILALNV